MERPVTRVTIVGGGTAGWLAACVIAARADPKATAPLAVTLVESPDVPTIGVGEGSWPTLRRTLARIGIGEREFLCACDAAFKQGSRFDGWRSGATDDRFHHPFTPPASSDARRLLAAWAASGDTPFASAICPQPAISDRRLAPRQRAMPDYAGALNYGYHLDAGKLAALLMRHAERLGVHYIRDHVDGVERAPDGDIAALRTRASGRIEGDLFIDCTGHAALLIGDALDVPFVDRGDVLCNDRALAVQLPTVPDAPIASVTVATAHDAGWIWDIGLPTRRGIGCVYASAFCDEARAEATLAAYLRAAGADGPLPPFRELRFRSGHRARFWEHNCLAIGLSAGFLEPLEASAIVLIELSLGWLLDNFPADRAVMGIQAARFNDLFRYRWDRTVEFLKLHYVLSGRETPYWRAQRDPASVPPRLLELLRLWRHQPPSDADFPMIDEVFSAASHQFVLYGMGFPTPAKGALLGADAASGAALAGEVRQRARALAAGLPDHRATLDALRADGHDLPKEMAH